MSAVRDCPKCGLINPPSAQRCDCGYDFVSRQMEASYLGKRDGVGELTLTETALCLLVPLLGVILGLTARQQGRRSAGNKMLIASVLMMVLPLIVAGMFFAAR